MDKLSNKWRKIKQNGSLRKKKRILLNSLARKSGARCTTHLVNTQMAVQQSQETTVPIIVPIQQNQQNSTWTEEDIDTPDNIEQIDNNNAIGENSEKAEASCRDKIIEWALKYQVTQSAIKTLLNILKPMLPNAELPNDARTLLRTPRNRFNNLLSGRNGENYWHYGLRKILMEALISHRQVRSQYSLNINIDGLPMFKSTTKAFWPILVEIHELKHQLPPLVVGIFCGKSKLNIYITFYYLLVRNQQDL